MTDDEKHLSNAVDKDGDGRKPRMDANGREWTRMDANGREWTRIGKRPLLSPVLFVFIRVHSRFLSPTQPLYTSSLRLCGSAF